MPNFVSDIRLLPAAVIGSVRDGIGVAWSYFQILVPLTLLLKLVMELGWLEYFSIPLKPLCMLTGLPPEFGIAWLAGMLADIYAAVFMLLGLLPFIGTPSVEQVTVLTLMVLLAHSLPVEARIAWMCGVSWKMQLLLRMVTALAAGMALHWFCMLTGLWSEAATVAVRVAAPDSSLWDWACGQLVQLLAVLGIICFVMLMQRALRHYHVADVLGRLLGPFLRRLGMGPAAATTVVVGLCMGLVYGSGVIIREARDGTLSRQDVFAALMFVSLSHAIIEDTCIAGLAGASLWGTVGVRLPVTVLVGLLLSAWMRSGRRKRKADTRI